MRPHPYTKTCKATKENREKALDGKGILGRYRDLRFTKTLFAERQLRVTVVKQQNRDSVLQGWCS